MNSSTDFMINVVIPLAILAQFTLMLLPIAIGFLWIRPDADRFGQPGLLWALATIPLNWIAVVAYLVVRATRTPRSWR